MTSDEALANAARLLENAETVTDLALMERLTVAAETWVSVATLLAERERV